MQSVDMVVGEPTQPARMVVSHSTQFIIVENPSWKMAYLHLLQHMMFCLAPENHDPVVLPQEHAANIAEKKADQSHSSEAHCDTQDSAPILQEHGLTHPDNVGEHLHEDPTHFNIQSAVSFAKPSKNSSENVDTFETDLLEHCMITVANSSSYDLAVDWSSPGFCNASILFEPENNLNRQGLACKANLMKIASPLKNETRRSRSWPKSSETYVTRPKPNQRDQLPVRNSPVKTKLWQSWLSHPLCPKPSDFEQAVISHIPLVLRKYCFLRTKTGAQDEKPVDFQREEESEEELEELPEAEKLEDPLLNAHIRKVIGNVAFNGYIEDIEVGRVTRERLYRVRYDDGDLEHMTPDQVCSCLT
eukprot:TRINITY_DN79038_c0_g1_i1.p1 TRINITY_DN79038_c0_g1~~TRINITY_DN79038_c0_g1_i1.p1  ORF type:complete len:360 (-),score=50.92 TRINITY_DN79038_c0_g1_i1:602-1681(-)